MALRKTEENLLQHDFLSAVRLAVKRQDFSVGCSSSQKMLCVFREPCIFIAFVSCKYRVVSFQFNITCAISPTG